MKKLFAVVTRVVEIEVTNELADKYDKFNGHVEDAAEKDDPNLAAMADGLDSLLVVMSRGEIRWSDEIVNHGWDAGLRRS